MALQQRFIEFPDGSRLDAFQCASSWIAVRAIDAGGQGAVYVARRAHDVGKDIEAAIRLIAKQNQSRYTTEEDPVAGATARLIRSFRGSRPSIRTFTLSRCSLRDRVRTMESGDGRGNTSR